jgi:hypothetical protein
MKTETDGRTATHDCTIDKILYSQKKNPFDISPAMHAVLYLLALCFWKWERNIERCEI